MQQRVIVCASPQGTGFKVKIVQQHCYSRALLLAVLALLLAVLALLLAVFVALLLAVFVALLLTVFVQQSRWPQ